MSPELLTIGMFGGLIVAIMMGVSLSFAVGGIAVIFALILNGPQGLYSVVSSTFGNMWSILLSAIPLFIAIGIALGRSKIADDLYRAFYLWSGKVNGGLLIGTSGFAAVLSAMTGNCSASTITTGLVGIPAMKRHGYNDRFVLGTIGASGTLGILIPPSITLIIIGMMTGLSVGKLFFGGLIAGLFILAAFIAYVAIKANLYPELAPSAEVSAPFREKVRALKSVLLPLLIVLSVLVSIFMGIATPTEAAAVGVAAVLFSVWLRGELTFTFIKEVSHDTASVTGMVVWIIFGAGAFVSIYSSGGGIAFMLELLRSSDLSPWALIILMQIAALIMGMFLDPVGIILLTLPIFFPIVVELGFDPIWFCVIFQLNLCIGYITPPFGYNLFYLKSLSPQTPISQIYIAVMPFLGIMLATGAFLMAVPSILISLTAMMN
ncbi:TRAP transporter large permease [Actibacterium sp. XHP0104]|uniref:TRAP transporter large permease n=1 Tax=Actibacterium sp. XHP0104 TaxID=2984335 RepID=UPI0021E8B63F|nr:TRAP transporter large permease subunit [Actibacterium sp. XHP0104]MCV2882988.1 TRAP transporter large permease subunit [Actibacterium sp. XHP0104]